MSGSISSVQPRPGGLTSLRSARTSMLGCRAPSLSHAPLYAQPHPADDPDAARRRGAGVLHAAHRAGRRRRGEAARRWRRRLAGDHRHGAQAARPRQAAHQPVRRLDDRARDARSRQVDVDRAAGDGGDPHPPRAVVAGCDHGDDDRGADRHTAGHDRGAVSRHLGRLSRAHHHHRRAVDPVVLVRHADHAGPALLLQLAAADHLHADLCRSGRQSDAADLAGARGRLSLLRGRRAHDPLLAAGGAERGLYPHRPRQGRVREAHHLAPCACAMRCCPPSP